MRFVLREAHEQAFREAARARFAARLLRWFGQNRPDVLAGVPKDRRLPLIEEHLGTARMLGMTTEASLARVVEAMLRRRGDGAFERWVVTAGRSLQGDERARSERVLVEALSVSGGGS